MSNDIVTLAREVLDAHEEWWKVHREDSPDAFADPERAIIQIAPDLARAVQRVAELADRLDAEADDEAAQGDTWDAVCLRAWARRIRDALNA